MGMRRYSNMKNNKWVVLKRNDERIVNKIEKILLKNSIKNRMTGHLF